MNVKVMHTLRSVLRTYVIREEIAIFGETSGNDSVQVVGMNSLLTLSLLYPLLDLLHSEPEVARFV